MDWEGGVCPRIPWCWELRGETGTWFHRSGRKPAQNDRRPAPSQPCLCWASSDQSVGRVYLASPRRSVRRLEGQVSPPIAPRLQPGAPTPPPLTDPATWKVQMCPWHLLSCLLSTPLSTFFTTVVPPAGPAAVTMTHHWLPAQPSAPSPRFSPVPLSPRPWHPSLRWATLRRKVPRPQEDEVGVQHGQFPSVLRGLW